MTTAAPTQSTVDTGKISRRTLRFNTIDEATAEAERLAAADRAGNLKRVGHWTLGQALGHLALWAEYSYTGAPLKVPLPIRLMLRMRKNKLLTQPMRAGVIIPKVPGGTLATDPMSLDDALPRFQTAMNRLKYESPAVPNIIFGPLTQEQWIHLNLRHAELHLSFFEPTAV